MKQEGPMIWLYVQRWHSSEIASSDIEEESDIIGTRTLSESGSVIWSDSKAGSSREWHRPICGPSSLDMDINTKGVQC